MGLKENHKELAPYLPKTSPKNPLVSTIRNLHTIGTLLTLYFVDFYLSIKMKRI